MNRRKFVQSAALVPLAACALPLPLQALTEGGATADARPDAMPDARPDAEKSTAHIAMREHYEVTLRRVLSGVAPAYTEEFVLEDVRPTPGRRFTEFSGDVSGRYIGALATASRVYGMTVPGLDGLVEKTIALQKPDGYFGSGFHYDSPTDQDLALLWGNGRLLVGLIEYYRLKPSPQVLAACTRLGDFLLRIGPLMLSQRIRDEFGAQHFASSYICWTQQSEGLANLYVITKDDRYRKLAEAIAAVTERRPSDHVHGYLTSLRGWVDLYNATGDAATLDRCEAAWHDVAQSKDLLITGGVPEGWSPNNHRTEGCGEVDWLRLSLGLWKATGKPEYLAMAERTLFNEFAFNQFASGDFGHHVYTETGLPAAGAVRAWWCCTLHGLRCFPAIQEHVFQAKRDGLYYDLPVSGETRGESSAPLSAIAASSLHEDGTVRITITAAPANATAVLSLRKPGWAENVAIQVNGAAARPVSQDGYLRLQREWRAGDVVLAKYTMALRSEPAGVDRTAYWVGPWLLGAPAAENAAYFNELTTQNRLTGKIEPATARSSPAHGFSIPVAAAAFRYIPAEFPDQPGSVELRAIAEQSGQPTTSWELRFLTAKQT